LPYLEKAAQCNPRSVQMKWAWLRASRLLDRGQDVERIGRELIALDPGYAPAYLELATYYENQHDYLPATQALDAYLTLAPNFADSARIREHADQLRPFAKKKAAKQGS